MISHGLHSADTSHHDPAAGSPADTSSTRDQRGFKHPCATTSDSSTQHCGHLLDTFQFKSSQHLSCRPNQIPRQRPLKLLHPNRHLDAIKRVLHNIIPIQLIAPPNHDIRIRLLRTREQQKLDSCGCLETRHPEVARLQALDACSRRFAIPRERLERWGRVHGARDGVDAVEGAGQDEVVVGVELLEAWGEGAVVDETACEGWSVDGGLER